MSAARGPQDDAVMDLLAAHVPLSLLCDLGTRGAPDSARILAAEGQPDRAWWEPAPGPGRAADPRAPRVGTTRI